MLIRDYSLPSGWYPRDPGEIERFLSAFRDNQAQFSACISPHAGWHYSGRIAARAISGLKRDAETVVILGGHLPAGEPVLFALEDAVKTPFNPMSIDTQFRSSLINELKGEEDRYRDNTIEVLLPIARFFFPNSKLLWLRLPAEKSSFNAGKIIFHEAKKLNQKITVIASTDLTHYGRNYGFSPKGSGSQALKWVREVNDANFIRAVESRKSDDVLLCAMRDSSSCSAGAVLGAMGFAAAAELPSARLLEYGTSADVNDPDDIPDSFVGYAAMGF